MRCAQSQTAAAVLAAGLALVTTLGACSSTPSSGPPAPRHAIPPVLADSRADAAPLLSEVSQRMSEQHSVRSTVQGDLGLFGDLTGNGTVRYAAPQADMELTGQTTPPKAGRPQPVELAIVDGVGYLKSPLTRAEPDKPWIKIAPDSADFAAKLLSPALSRIQNAIDPRATFAGIEQATKIQSAVPDVVDGRHTTRYELRVLASKAAALTHDPQQQRRFTEAANTGHPELVYQLWVDDSRLPVRFTATQNLPQAGEVSLTSEYRDWGAPATITAPPASEIGTIRDSSAEARRPG